eukprot:PITA_05323
MASQGNVGYLETENKSGGVGAQRGNSCFFVVDVILRLLAIGCTFSAAIVMGTNKQMVMLPIIGPWPAKYQYSPAFVFFVVANAVACGYTLISFIFSVTGNFASSTLSDFLLSVTDLVMVALVSAGFSAAAAIAYVGYKGNSHTQWGKICGIYDRFCNHVIGALTASFVSLIILLVLTVMNIYSIYRRTSRAR